MLKKRIAANLVLKDGIVVQSINFKKYLPVGKPEVAIEFLNQWGIDEIILTEISATSGFTGPNFNLIKSSVKKCLVPLTVGGGITEIGQMKKLMQCGADKISLNQAAIKKPHLITEAAHLFGDQCVVVSIDSTFDGHDYKVYDYVSKVPLVLSPALFARRCQELGAGEIMINSVERDGSYLGYDIELINSVCEAVTIPVICCGGAKNAGDMAHVLKATHASAASAANFFHFTEHSVTITKANIQKEIDVRHETFADYKDNEFDAEFRLNKKDDTILEKMLYLRIEKEII